MVRIVGQVRDITEQKERELHLETIIGNLPGYVYRHEYESDYPLKFVKGDAESVTGYTATELEEEIGQAEEIIHPDDREDLWAEHLAGLEEYGRFDSTYRIRTKEGDVRWIRDQGQLIEDPVTGEEVIDGFITDTSDKIQQQQEIQTQETFIDESMDAIQDVFYVVDSHGDLLRWNERVPAVTGYTEEQLEEMEAIEFFAEEHHERIVEGIREIMETGSSAVRADIITAAGERRSFELRGTRLTDPYRKEPVAIGIGRDISEQVESERELEHTNVLLSTLFETLPVGIIAEDEDRNVLAANERVFDLFGTLGSPEEAVGEDCERLARDVSEKFVDSEGFVERIDELVSERIPTDGEELSLRDGRVLERSHRPIELASGDGHLWVYQDITDREQYEQTIASLHDTANDVLRADTEERVGEVMVEAIAELLGMPINGLAMHDDSEDVLRLTVDTDHSKDFVDSDSTFRPGESLAWEVFETGETAQYDDVSTVPGRQNPDTRIRSEIIVPLGDHGVVLIGSTDVGRFDETDVSLVETLASHAETALDRIERERELEVKNQRLDAILENTTTVMFMKDDDGNYLFSNRQYRELFDLGDEQIVGRTDFDLHPPDVAQAVWENDRRVLDQGEPLEVEERIPVGGEERVFLSSKVPIYDTGDRFNPDHPVAVFGVASDITELRGREEQLQNERDRLNEFASVVSHDIRNPLGIAKGHLELLREESDSEHIVPIDHALTRMDTLLDDLLTLAREGDRVGEREPVDVAELAETCWRTVDMADATLRTPIDRTIQADRSRLAQLLENLFGNAVEHGRDDVTVTVGELEDGFYVEDDGPGIPESMRETVFDAGYSTTEDGTGFGLGIVKQVAEAHGWELRLTDGSDGGARFEFVGVE